METNKQTSRQAGRQADRQEDRPTTNQAEFEPAILWPGVIVVTPSLYFITLAIA